jgi:hypothetical protein
MGNDVAEGKCYGRENAAEGTILWVKCGKNDARGHDATRNTTEGTRTMFKRKIIRRMD